MKQLWVVVVLIWLICENEIYLFTKADYKRITFNFTENLNVSFSCDNFSRIRIVNISVGEESTPCKNTICDVNEVDTETIHNTCDGRNECVLKMEWSTACFRKYGYYDVTYLCNATCNFEESACNFDTSSNNDVSWKHVAGSEISGLIGETAIELPDHTMNSTDGHFMFIKLEGKGKGTMKTQRLHYDGQRCLSFWYVSFELKRNKQVSVELKIFIKKTEYRTVIFTTDEEWHFFNDQIYIENNDDLRFKSIISSKNNVLFGIDDVSLSTLSNKCSENVPLVSKCLSTDEYVTLDACQSFFLNQLSIDFKHDVYRTNQSSQVCQDVNKITQRITTYCATKLTWEECKFSLKNITKDDRCLQLDKQLNIVYLCLDASVFSSHEITTHEQQSPKDSTMSKQTISTISLTDDTISNRHTTTTSPQTEDHPDFRSSSTSSTSVTDIQDFRSSSTSSTSVTGIVVGVVLSVVAISVCLIVSVIYFRRSRYFEKKANPIVVEKNNHNDYTGHQNVAFSPAVNGNTQTDYCEIRTSKHNEQYHDISDSFRPLINTANDDEYSEIANVVNSPNNNPNPSTNYQHQYISLDPNATGFDRTIPQNNLPNECKNNQNSNEKTSFTGGDDYAILDPDDLNESKNNTPKVLPLSDNYVVLDPNETGFNRQEITNTVCNYELATSFNPKETSEDPYDVSKDETYDTSCNSRHKEKENNIYSHSVDNVYDTAGNQRKKEDNDGTYDHFYGQQSEDDYDISKPL